MSASSLNGRRRPRVVFLTDIITPYFVPTFEELARLVDLTVVFCDDTGSRAMDWSFGDLGFRHRIVGGLVIGRGNPNGTDYYVDPRILTTLARAKPEVIISGAFSVPTAYAALHGALGAAGS